MRSGYLIRRATIFVDLTLSDLSKGTLPKQFHVDVLFVVVNSDIRNLLSALTSHFRIGGLRRGAVIHRDIGLIFWSGHFEFCG